MSRRILRLLVRCGRLRETEGGYAVVPREEYESAATGSALESFQSASIGGRIALGPHAGRRVRRLGDLVEVEWGAAHVSRPRCAEREGFSLHADVCVGPGDRERLERLCRYIARPAIATERLRELEDGRIAYMLRHPWRDGTTGMVFDPVEFIGKLVSLVPAPRGHLVRYHGVLAPHSRWRATVVRDREVAGPGAEPESNGARGPAPGPEPTPLGTEMWEIRERRLSWSQLMLRVFAKDVLECPRCKGRRSLIAVITEPEVIRAFLASLGLPTRAPPLGPAREVDAGEAAPDEFTQL